MTAMQLLTQVEDAMASGSAARRGKIVRHVTDLFIVGSAQCTEQEIALFDDVLTRLAAEIETSARALLAVRLAPVENAPPRIIHALAFDDEIDVAGPVLEQSVRLDDGALLENARQKGQAHLLAISRRQALSEQVIAALHQQVVLSTAENRGARFSAAGFSVMVRRADGDDRLAASVGARPEIPQHLFNKLLAKASKSVRAKLEAAHPQARREVRLAIEEVTERLRAEGPAAPLDYGAARAYIDALQRRGQFDERKLEMIASVGRFEEIAVALSVKCQLPLEFVERALTQERSEMLLVIAKAAGLPWSTVKAMLTGRAIGRHASGGDLAQALASYERLKGELAREIVGFHRRRAEAGSRAPI